MKTIRCNDIKIEELKNIDRIKTTPKQSTSRFIKADEKQIKFVGSEFAADDGIFLSSSLHPFVEAARMAYSDHLPLVISPDMIWYLITSGAAVHINKNAEKLRTTFVNHQGKQLIEIRRDDFSLDAPNPWNEVIDEFASEISKRTNNGIEEKIVADFTTTSKIARIVSQIVLMDAMKQYFDYRFSTLCGIPEVRLTGTKQDWLNLKTKTNDLIQLLPDLKIWMKSLDEILSNFVDVFNDKIDSTFWNSIFKISGGSGGPYLSGWIIALFPYLNKERENHFVFEKTWRNVAESFGGGITTSSFDYHMNQVPFIWNYFGTEIKMLFVGGISGIKYGKDHSVTPLFSYAVVEEHGSDEKKLQLEEL